jgi:hypothetical protein
MMPRRSGRCWSRPPDGSRPSSRRAPMTANRPTEE